MNQIYLVIESNGESYEDYHEWPIAAFDDEVKAKEYADKCQEKYNEDYKDAQNQSTLWQEKYDELIELGIDYEDYKQQLYDLCLQYPLANYGTYSSHTFSVSKPIPFNPL